MKEKEELQHVLKEFWDDEIVATDLYGFLSKRAKDDEQKKLFKSISEMESRHAKAWQDIANSMFGISFKEGWGTRLRKFYMRTLARILPSTFMIKFLELDEQSAVIGYSKLLEHVKDDPETTEKVQKIIRDEVHHEGTLINLIMEKAEYLSRIGDAIYGMTDSLVEILALVIGLAGLISNPILIGLAGMISAIGGTFSMTSGAYLSTQSENDIYEGKIQELEIKERVVPDTLKDDLKRALISKKVEENVADEVVSVLKNDTKGLAILLKSLAINETFEDAKASAITTGKYYILGALPAIVPFFLGFLFPITPLWASIIAIVSAAIISFVAGIFTAVLSGTKIKSKAFKNVLFIIGSTFATYMIGTLARTFLGIEV